MAQTFQAQITYDLDTCKEYNRGYALYSAKANISKLLLIAALAFFIFVFAYVLDDTSFTAKYFLIFTAFYWGMRFFIAIKNRNGDVNYKRILSSNNGVPPRMSMDFDDEGIHLENLGNGNRNTFRFEQVRGIYETENLLVIVLEHSQVIPLRKDTLNGGSQDDFSSFLISHCASIKKKKLASLVPGKIIQVLVAVFFICGTLVSLWNLPFVKTIRHNALDINNTMPYSQIALELEKMGITGSDHEMTDSLDNYWALYSAYETSDYPKVIDLLCWLGYGDYDPETTEWTPSENGVYWFDLESMGVDTMYTDFLLGIRALDPANLNFTDIQEDLNGVDLEDGTGTRSVTFLWNGESHCLEAKAHYDWFDIQLAKDLNAILRTNSDGNQLYFASDEAQGFLVFYKDAAWAKSFTKKTGISLSTDPTRVYYGY